METPKTEAGRATERVMAVVDKLLPNIGACHYNPIYSAVLRELSALTDTRRMDWLQQQHMRAAKSMEVHREGETMLMAWNRDGHCCPIIHNGDFRGAVDAAMKRDPLG